jgi:hypothetical protein
MDTTPTLKRDAILEVLSPRTRKSLHRSVTCGTVNPVLALQPVHANKLSARNGNLEVPVYLLPTTKIQYQKKEKQIKGYSMH